MARSTPRRGNERALENESVSSILLYDAGMPIRPQKKNDVLELPLNQWGRVIYNGRVSGMEGSFWRYRQRVLNIGLFEEVVASVFVATEPHVVMDKTAVLY